MLRDHTWAFSKVFVVLTKLTPASTVTPWLYQFQLPSDVARILSFGYDDYPVRYEQVAQILHSDRSTGNLRYIKNFAAVDDGFSFPTDFAEALSNILAAELAMSLTQTQSLRDDYLNMYMACLRSARFNGAVEQDRQPDFSSSWVDAHDGFLGDIDPRVRGLSGY